MYSLHKVLSPIHCIFITQHCSNGAGLQGGFCPRIKNAVRVEELFDLLVEGGEIWVLRGAHKTSFEPTLTTAHHQMTVV